jgi:small ligand-binding sensory domain FIST
MQGPTRVGAGISTGLDPRAAATEAAQTAAGPLGDAEPDLAVVFAAGAHLAAPEETLEAIHDTLAPGSLVGCGAGGVLGSGRELESGTAIAVWAAHFADGTARPFHAQLEGDDDEAVVAGMPEVGPGAALMMLCDPYSFPADLVLAGIADALPGLPVLGGLSSAQSLDGEATLFFEREVCRQGAVGVSLEGIEMLPCVSQGAAPLGRELTITAAEANIIYELAGQPAITTIEQVIAGLSMHDRALIAGGLLLGVVIDGGKPEYEQGDFLVRGVLGADAETGAIVVGANVKAGQVVRLHARDARSADEDLRRALRLRAQAIGGQPAGALVFSCNGRGQQMFGISDHDASLVAEELGGAPAAGFFAAGEIGPVGGRSFLHGFTATVAVFPG